MASTKKRATAALTAAILTIGPTIPAMAAKESDESVQVIGYKGNTLEVGERGGLIIGPSGADYTVTSSDPDTVAVEQVLTFWVAVSKCGRERSDYRIQQYWSVWNRNADGRLCHFRRPSGFR